MHTEQARHPRRRARGVRDHAAHRAPHLVDEATTLPGVCDGGFLLEMAVHEQVGCRQRTLQPACIERQCTAVGNFTGEADYLEQKECLAGAPRIYGQLVSILGKYSKFASAGDKASVRQAVAPAAAVGTTEVADAGADVGADADSNATPDEAGAAAQETAAPGNSDAPF